MQEIKSDLELHVFVCTNKKEGKECCAKKGGEELRSELKSWAKEHKDWKKRVRINASGCLDHCKDGIAIAIYPQNRWITNVDLDDIDDVKKIIEEMME